MNPADLANQRWKPFRTASDRVARALTAYAEAQAKLEELRRQLGPAEAQDELELGRALLDEKAEPKSQADAIREQIRVQERRVAALQRAHTDAGEQLAKVIEENKQPWRREAFTEISKARTRCEAAITELEDARENLSSVVGLCEWIASGGAATADPANDRLAGSGSLGFSEVLAALRADLEHLVSYDSLERETPVRVAFERISRTFG